MELLFALFEVGLALFFLSLLFIPMEKVFPAKKEQPIFRKHWMVDLSFFLGQYLLWHGLVSFALGGFEHQLQQLIPVSVQQTIASQPFYVQVVEVILFSDLLIYWGHRFQHNNNFLWRFHKVHHSAEKLDWLAAHREHPLDTIYTVGLINLPAMIMGFPLETIAAVIFFRGIWAIYIHSNVRLPIGPFKYIIGSPELHHWHHDLERDRGNYANLSPLMDLMFGTYTCPDHEPESFGIKEDFGKSYIEQMLEPVIPDAQWKKIKRRFQQLRIQRTGNNSGIKR